MDIFKLFPFITLLLLFKLEYLDSEGFRMKCDDNGVCSMESLKCDEAKQSSKGTDGKEFEYLDSEGFSMKCDDNGVCSMESFKCDEAKQSSKGTDGKEFDVAFSDSCTHLNEISGTISNEINYENMYSKCWKIVIPSNSYIQLNMISFDTYGSEDCSRLSVEVSITNRKDKYTFCPGESDWQPIIAFNDVTVTHKIYNDDYYFDYGVTSSFSMSYRGESYLCAQKDIFRCDNGLCIPQSQVCDGTKHCYNGDDEKGCETGVFAVPGVDDSRLKGISLLKEKWSPSSGWQENTHRGIIALHLATESNSAGVDIERKLMMKQLEAQALASLLRNATDPLSANQLSMFVNALTASCQDPRNFYGFDLVKLLKDKAATSPLTAQPVFYLALCNTGETLPANGTRELSKILNSDSEYPFLLDVQAAAVMAISCLRANEKNGSNSSLIDGGYEEAVARLKTIQLKDGSFGNIYTTAIVTQALLSAGEENSKDWNLQAAVKHLMKHLNSSSVDFLATYLILPVLNGKSLSDIRNINCSVGFQQKSQGNFASDVKIKLGPKMRVQYSLYIGDEKDIVHTMSLRVPENITVFEVMQLAEEADSKYKFQWKRMGQEIYVYDIAGIVNDLEDGLFWLLYVGKDVNSVIHVRESPDKLTVNDGAQIIMWYKKATI